MQQLTSNLFHWMLDKAIPNNCRKRLKEASEDNLRACDNLICVLQKHKPKLKVVK